MFGLFDKADIIITTPIYVIMEDTFDCIVEIYPKSNANLTKIQIELYCEETAITRGTSNTYHRKIVYTDSRIPKRKMKLQKEIPLKFKEIFNLPQFTTPTIMTKNHFVEWFVHVRLDIPWWPDTNKKKAIFVAPYLVEPEIEYNK